MHLLIGLFLLFTLLAILIWGIERSTLAYRDAQWREWLQGNRMDAAPDELP